MEKQKQSKSLLEGWGGIVETLPGHDDDDDDGDVAAGSKVQPE